MTRLTVTLSAVENHQVPAGLRLRGRATFSDGEELFFTYRPPGDSNGEESVRLFTLSHRAGVSSRPRKVAVLPKAREAWAQLHPARVWIVQADHWEVPGRPMFAYTSEAAANAKAATLVNDLVTQATAGEWPALEDCDLKPTATPDDWKGPMIALQTAFLVRDGQDPEEFSFDPDDAETSVWITETPLDPKEGDA